MIGLEAVNQVLCNFTCWLTCARFLGTSGPHVTREDPYLFKTRPWKHKPSFASVFEGRRDYILETIMNTLTVSILVCVVAAASAHNEDPPPLPPFCNGLECPRFTVKRKTADYEERCYQPYKWASTVVAGYTYKKAVGMGFMRLFDYIEGANNKSVKIPMTAPVLVQIQPAQGPYCKNNFTVNFFVPFDLQANPIPPTSKDVFISSMPAMCAYVKTYPGRGSNTDDILKNAAELAEALTKDKLGDTYHKDFYYYAGYDSPFKLFDRTNDIWFVKK